MDFYIDLLNWMTQKTTLTMYNGDLVMTLCGFSMGFLILGGMIESWRRS